MRLLIQRMKHCSFQTRFWMLQALVLSVLLIWGSYFVLTPAHAGDFNMGYGAVEGPLEPSPIMTNGYVTPTDASALPVTPAICPTVKVHLTNSEFPARPFAQYPTDPIAHTQFTAYLNETLMMNGGLQLINDIQDADYRVELRCTGALHCGQLQVNLFDAKRLFISSVTIPARRAGANTEQRLYSVATAIAQVLHRQIAAHPMGISGTYSKD